MALFAITTCGQARAVTEDMELMEGEYLSEFIPEQVDTSSYIIWRNSELTRADIMLNRVQDGETGIGTQKAWRAYRVSLRDWPATESFPLDAPVAPDAK